MEHSSTRARIARNAGALYVVQLVSFLVPIFEIPILARALGPALYGQILFCQALALTASLLVEYGFNINAAQQAALARGRPGELNRLFSQVLLAKILLAVPLAGLMLAAWALGLLDVYLSSAALLGFVLAYFLAFGFSPMWYFQGRERMAGPALLDVVLRLCGLGVLAVLIRAPGDFLLALPILAIPPLLNTALTLGWCRLEVGPVRRDFQGACRQIREGFHFFVYRSASNLALSAIPVFLGLSAGKQAVGEFAPPEKLIKGMTSLAMPFLSAVFPVYILHQTVIIALAHTAKPRALPPLLEGPPLVVLIFAACFGGYEPIRRLPVRRPRSGLRREARRLPLPDAPPRAGWHRRRASRPAPAGRQAAAAPPAPRRPSR